jgi:hypothetical protein
MFMLIGSDGRLDSDILIQEWSKCFEITEAVSVKILISRELTLCAFRRIWESQLNALFMAVR